MFVVLLCLILLDIGSISQSASVADCPVVQDPSKMRVFENKCFQFVLDQSYEFAVAERYCAEKGGTLAMPKTKQINDFLVSTLRNSFYFSAEVWIGLDDRKYEHLFKWADGTTLVYTTDYSNWAEDNGHRSNSLVQYEFEDCVFLDARDGLWHDLHCQNEPILFFNDYTRPFICEYKITAQSTQPTPETTTEPPTPQTVPATTPDRTTIPPTTTPATTNQPTTEPPTTIPPTTTPTPTTPATTVCPPFVCDLDCGLTGYVTDPTTGCALCECDN